MTEYTIKILIVGIPGIICFFLSQKLYGKRVRSNTDTILLVFLYAVLSYGIVGTVEATLNYRNQLGFVSDTFDIFLGKNQDVSLKVLIKGIVAGISLAYILSFCINYNIANRVGQFFRITKRYGDEDVWHYFHNSPDAQKNDGWLIVRDLKEQLVYYCYISTWSDSDEERELILSDVSVYSNESGDYLYSTDHIYLSRNKDDLMIEVPPLNAEESEEYKLDVKEKENVQ